MEDYEAKYRLMDTRYIVRASSAEALFLWNRWNERLKWKQENEGRIEEIGKIGGTPIMIELSWNILNGQRVMFWTNFTALFDFGLAEKWLQENCPNARLSVDTINFGSIWHEIKDR